MREDLYESIYDLISDARYYIRRYGDDREEYAKASDALGDALCWLNIGYEKKDKGGKNGPKTS